MSPLSPLRSGTSTGKLEYRSNGQKPITPNWKRTKNNLKKLWKQKTEAYKEQSQKALEAKDNEIKALNNDLANLSKSRSDLVRKLDAYKARERTLAECRNDRARMADVAVGLDDFAQRLVTRTRSMIK